MLPDLASDVLSPNPLLLQPLLIWTLPFMSHASSPRLFPYVPDSSRPSLCTACSSLPRAHFPSMSSWQSLPQTSRLKLKFTTPVAPFLFLGKLANTFPSIQPCNAFIVTLAMSYGVVVSVSATRI